MKNFIDISECLKELGIAANLKGYYCIRYAVMLLLDDLKYVSHATTKLYPEIAEYFDTTASRVERAIRHAIEKGWGRGNIELQNKMFGYSIDMSKDSPTNMEFITTVADYIRMYKMEVAVK